MTLIQIISAVLAVGGVKMNNHKMRFCFVVWMGSNALSCCIHMVEGLWPLAGRDAIFFVLAIDGWRLWGKSRS